MRTVYYYNLAIYKNDIKTNNSFLDLLDGITNIEDRLNVARKVNNSVISVYPMKTVVDVENIRIISFGKFRMKYKPFTGEITSTSLKTISNSVVEVNTIFYDETYKTIIVESNNLGLNKATIEEYLSSFIKQAPYERWDIRLTPIIVKNKEDEMKKSEQIKGVEIRLKLDKVTEKLINGEITEKTNCIGKLFNDFPNGIKNQLDANVLNIEFGVGLNKKSSLNLSGIKLLLDQLNLENDNIESIKIRYKNNNKKVDALDLKNINQQLKDVILKSPTEENPSLFQIGNSIYESYKTYEETIVDSYLDFRADLEEVGGYDFQTVPSEMYRVEVKNNIEEKGESVNERKTK